MFFRGGLLAHVETWRPYTAAYVGLVGLLGATINGVGGAMPLAVAWGVPTLAWAAGLYGGDYFDRELDAIQKPTRPIPSGRLNARTAFILMWTCAIVGAGVAVTVNPWTVLVAAAAFALGIAYSKVLKGWGIAGNLVRGMMMALVVVFGAMTGGAWPGVGILLPALAVCAHDVASNVVGTIRDIDGDREGGYRTVSVAWGTRLATILAAGCYGLALLAALGSVIGTVGTSFATSAVLLATAIAGGSAFGLLVGQVTRADALRAHSALLLSRILLAWAMLMPGFGSWSASIAGGSALIFTMVTERLLRVRHEGMAVTRPSLTSAEIESFVDEQVRTIAALTAPPRTLERWKRTVRIDVTEPHCRLELLVGHGKLRRVGVDDTIPGREPLRITTTGATFHDIFVTGRSNPRRAFLLRQLRFEGTASDMVNANALFAEFRSAVSSPAAAESGIRVSERIQSDVTPDQLPPQVVISDTTLRDGEQMPGIAFSVAEKVEIARLLDDAGVALIEAGFPAVSPAEAAAVREIVDLGLGASIQAIARPTPRDIEAAVASGVDSVAIFIGTSDLHVFEKLRLTRHELLRHVGDGVRLAASSGVSVVFAAEDATRTDPKFLVEVFDVARDAGAHALGMADTAGVAHPALMRAIVSRVADAVPLPIGVHCHDDLGLAVANSLAGLQSGATGVQCSVTGIGERAGNASLEELVLALEVAHDHRTGIDLTRLLPLAELLSRAAGLPVPPNKPVVGSHMFVHESGLHLDGVIRQPACYEPYPPEWIGAQRRIVLGKHSGRSCVTAVLEEAGRTATAEQVDQLLGLVKEAAESRRQVSSTQLQTWHDALADPESERCVS